MLPTAPRRPPPSSRSFCGVGTRRRRRQREVVRGGGGSDTPARLEHMAHPCSLLRGSMHARCCVSSDLWFTRGRGLCPVFGYEENRPPWGRVTSLRRNQARWGGQHGCGLQQCMKSEDGECRWSANAKIIQKFEDTRNGGRQVGVRVGQTAAEGG